MLKSIRCDKFLSMGKIREPILFHKGLNTVLGSSDAKNSIGKSTLLMIIDFVFGGTDYVTQKTKEVISNIGDHTFEFCFVFDEVPLYFSRSTDNYNVVNICDSNYSVMKTISLDLFNKSLAARYKLNENGISLRDAIGRYFRIYHREATDEKYPLRASSREKVNDQITALIKLFDCYNAIIEQDQVRNQVSDKHSTIKKAINFNQVKAPSNKTEFSENERKIKDIELRIDEIMRDSQNGLSDLDAIKAQELADIKQSLSKLRRQRTQIKSQIEAIQNDKDYSNKNIKHDYDTLRQFFPEANYASLNQIEIFHSKLTSILKSEFKEKTNELGVLFELISSEIDMLQQKAKQIETTPDLSKAILVQYAELSKEALLLKEANKNFIEKDNLNTLVKNENEKYENLVKSTIIQIQNKINAVMKQYNDSIYNGRKTSPELLLKDSSHYLFHTPNDTGTGSLLRGLIIFDLSILQTTKLPAVIHDTIILKHIDDPTLEKILEIYAETEKQVFIAFDRDSTYNNKIQTILNETKVIKLTPNGNELFGTSWNEIEKKNDYPL